MTLRALLFPALLALAISACGSCGEKGASKSAEQGGAPRKVFRFFAQSAPRSLDPVKQFDQASAYYLDNVYDRLVTYHYLKRPYTLVPNLLTRLPEVSEDGLTLSFELRDDVKFMDDPCFPGGKGRSLTTDDVIYSIKRFADANENIQSYSLLEGVIDGMDEFRKQTKELGAATDYGKLQIRGIQKVDDRHFTIKLTRKNPIAMMPFATAPLSIVPREAVEHYKERFAEHPVGTGPFRLKTLARRGTSIFERNPNYHLTYPTEGEPGDAERGLLAAAGKRLPFFDEVQLQLIEEAQPSILKFLAGELDWVALDKDNFANMAYKDASGFHLKPKYAAKYDIYTAAGLSTEYFAFNLNDPLVGKSKALRQAMAYAFDPPAYVEKMRNGRGVAPTSIVPPAIAGGQNDVKTPWYPHDLAMAKKKLAEAGFPDGKGLGPITVENRASSTFVRQDSEFFRAQLAPANITLAANYQSFTAFAQRVDAGNFQVIKQGWGADYPDAENFYGLLYSGNKAPGPNAGSYANPEYDKLYEQIKQLPNGPERFALFARMNEIIREDVPVIPVWAMTIVGLHQKWVKNFKRNLMMDAPFAYLDLDPALQAKGVPR